MTQEHKKGDDLLITGGFYKKEVLIDDLLITSKRNLDDGVEGPEIARDLIGRGANFRQIQAVLDELGLLLPPSGKPEELRVTLRPEPISSPHHRGAHPRIEIIDLSK